MTLQSCTLPALPVVLLRVAEEMTLGQLYSGVRHVRLHTNEPRMVLKSASCLDAAPQVWAPQVGSLDLEL